MRERRSRGDASGRLRPAGGGLTRRGWIVFVGSTAAVAVVLVAAALLLISLPAAHAGGHASSSTTQTDWLPAPDPDLRPTPLGLPPRPTPTPVATVPAQPVESLKTGDCLQLYPSAWEDSYPVVDCAAPHIAQVLSRGTLPQPTGAPFPGTLALQSQVSDLCAAPGLLNWNWVAVWNEDTLTDLRYPNTAAQWATGARSYYCFVYTGSRHELTGSAVAGG